MEKKIFFLILFLLMHNLMIIADTTAADARAMALQSDNKVIIAGAFTQNKQNVFGCARYLTSGILDTAFGDQGITLISQADQAEANAVALQSDGKIVVGGFYSDQDIARILCARFNSDGSLDSNFGQNGLIIENDFLYAQVADIKVQTDGKIIITGTYAQEGQLSIFLIRYLTNGLRDTSFGDQGFSSYRAGYHSGSSALGIQSDGKIIVGGFNVSDSRELLLLRFSSGGTLDSLYGQDGAVFSTVGTSSQVESLVIDTNDRVVIAGTSDNQFLTARYLPSGVLDEQFGNRGYVITQVGIWASAFAVNVQSDGKILVGGYGDQSLGVIRLTSTGSLDTTFNANGIVTKLIANNGNCAKAIEVMANSNILVAGVAGNSSAVLMLDPINGFKTSWGGNGIVTYPAYSLGNPLTIIADYKPSGTNGGTFTAGSWITRDLTQIITSSSNISLHDNYFTLQPGIYDISIFAPAFMCGNHKIRLQNITNNVTEFYGVAAYSSADIQTSVSNSFLEMTLVVKNPTDYEVQHRCSITRENDGFGVATSFDDNEVYTAVKIIEK